MEDQRYWFDYSVTDFTGWQYRGERPGYVPGALGNSVYGNGMYLATFANTGAYLPSDYGQYYFQAAGDTTGPFRGEASHIFKADFGYTTHTPAGGAGSCISQGIYSTVTSNWEQGAIWRGPQPGSPYQYSPVVNCGGEDWNYRVHCLSVCGDDGGDPTRGTPGNWAVLSMLLPQGGYRTTGGIVFMRSSLIFESEYYPPHLTANGPDGWVDDAPIAAQGTDYGLGTHQMRLTALNGTEAARTVASCDIGRPPGIPGANNGDRNHRCPRTLSLEASTGPLPEGAYNATVEAKDVIGNTAVRYMPLRIDRTPPTVALSGPLKSAENTELAPGSHELQVVARDGDANGPESAQRSGVESVEILLDGESVDFARQDCSDGSCELSRGWTFNTQDHPGGDHVVDVIAEDQVGRQTRQSFSFSTGPCCTESAALWGNGLGNGTVLFGDVDGDALTDAAGRDTLSRELEVGLSNGSAFGDFTSWGRLAELDLATDLALGDANGDGRDDLIGRNPATGQVLVAVSNGSSFQTPLPWGSWPASRTLRIVDVDGDGSVDLSGRDTVDGKIYVGYSTEAAFEAGSSLTSYAVSAGDDWFLEDVDSDFAADLVLRSGDTVRVGLHNDSTFGTPQSWGSVPTGRRMMVGDVNGDGNADLIALDESDGRLTLSTSTGSAFRSPTAFGTFPVGYRTELIDGNGDGQRDLAGQHRLLGDLQVAPTNMATATGPPAGDWQPRGDVIYDTEDENTPAPDPPTTASASQRMGGNLGTTFLNVSKPIRLGFQDQRRLLDRIGIPDPAAPGTVIQPDQAYGARAADAEAAIGEIYKRLREAGGAAPGSQPIIRFIVLWGTHQNRPGATQPYFFDKLDRAITLARNNGFLVYLTLSGATTDLECNFGSQLYNPESLACATGPTGEGPDPAAFGEFARAVALRFRGRVTAYGLWNEPNNADFLQAPPNKFAPTHDLYRRLYQEAFGRMQGTGARVFFGELSHLVRQSNFCIDSDCGRKSLSAKRYLKLALESAPDGTPVQTHGVAWHPYQHVKGPRNRGALGVVGIGRANEIQEQIDMLWAADPPGAASSRLSMPGGARPDLYFTEFGYFNGPFASGRKNSECRGCGNAYFKTEAGRGALFRQALSRAQSGRTPFFGPLTVRVEWL